MRYGFVELTQGNINNDHLYLAGIYDMFPPNSIGGASEADVAGQLLEIHFGVGAPVLTDIAGDKKIFRRRAWVPDFFAMHDLVAGDSVVVEQTGRNRYHVYPLRRLIGT